MQRGSAVRLGDAPRTVIVRSSYDPTSATAWRGARALAEAARDVHGGRRDQCPRRATIALRHLRAAPCGLSVAVDTLPTMKTRWAGSAGRYQASCGEGHCALTGDRASSKIEGQIFTLLNYVLGNGELDMQTYVGSKRLRIDMIFTLKVGHVLAVEYDGAYWHRGHEDRDRRKTELIEARWPDRKCLVVRVREHPLTPLGLCDVQVPFRADTGTCAQLILLHLAHLSEYSYDFGAKLEVFLRASPHTIKSSEINCWECSHHAQNCLSW